MHAVAAVKAVPVGILVTQAGCYIKLCVLNTAGGVSCYAVLSCQPVAALFMHCTVATRSLVAIARDTSGHVYGAHLTRLSVGLSGVFSAVGTGRSPATCWLQWVGEWCSHGAA